MTGQTQLDGYKRYAVYYVPEAASGLGTFGQAWFGFDPATGETVGPERFGLSADLHDRAIAAPARYALHATMKAPFRPATGVSGTRIAEALRAFSLTARPVFAPPLRFIRMDSYLALTTTAAELNDLEAALVHALDWCRAPLAPEDFAKRPAASLSPRQNDLMQQVGYPFALDEFRFHISLAGRLNEAELRDVEKALKPVLSDELNKPFRISELALFGDPGEGHRFRLLSRAPFGRGA